MRQQEACIGDADHDILLETGSRSIELNFMLDFASKTMNHHIYTSTTNHTPFLHAHTVT